MIYNQHTILVSTNRQINVREYRRDNQKRTIQRNWHHRAHKTKKKQNKAKTICNLHFYTTSDDYSAINLPLIWDSYKCCSITLIFFTSFSAVGERHRKTKCLTMQKINESFTRLARQCSDKLPFFCSDKNISSHEIDKNICQHDGKC